MDMICTAFSFQNPYAFPLTQLSQNTACCSTLLSVEHLSSVFWRKKLCDIYSSIGCALSSFRSPLGPPFDFLFDTCSCQTAPDTVFLFRDKERSSTIPDPAYDFPGHDVLLSARRRHRYEAHPRVGTLRFSRRNRGKVPEKDESLPIGFSPADVHLFHAETQHNLQMETDHV